VQSVSVLWLDLIDKRSDVFLDVLYDPLRRTGEAATSSIAQPAFEPVSREFEPRLSR